MSGVRTGVALVCLLALVALGLASNAWAGDWMQVSCVNPDGSAAPSQGWTGGPVGTPQLGAYAATNCGPGVPMAAGFGAAADAPSGDEQALIYTPPTGSSLVGGHMLVHMFAGGYGETNGTVTAVATAAIGEPTMSYSDRFFQCIAWAVNCSSGANGPVDYSGPVTLPAGRGGALNVNVICSGSGPACNINDDYGSWALAQVYSADLLLSSSVSPSGTGFTGSALQPGARGTAHIVFTAAESAGPGIYAVGVAIDGRLVSGGTPDTNGGSCASVGRDSSSGALEFDAAQPCLTSETVDVPVPTATLPDGSHRLTVSVTDAAGNSAIVFDQSITTSNPQLTPRPTRGVRAQFVISWGWSGAVTRLRSVSVRRLPRGARVSVACVGRGCPRLRDRAATGAGIPALLHTLRGRRFRAGDRLRILVTAPRRRAERVVLKMRTGELPSARLVDRF